VNEVDVPALRELIPIWANVDPPDDVEVQLRDILPSWILATAKLSDHAASTEPLAITPAPQASRLTTVSRLRENASIGPVARKSVPQPDDNLPAWAANAAIKLAGLEATEDLAQGGQRPARPDLPTISWKNLASEPGAGLANKNRLGDTGATADEPVHSTKGLRSRAARGLSASPPLDRSQTMAMWKEQITLSLAGPRETAEPTVAPAPPADTPSAMTVRMIVEAALIELGELDPSAPPPPRLDPIPIPTEPGTPTGRDAEPLGDPEALVPELPDRRSES
jgi:hypothetical protein